MGLRDILTGRHQVKGPAPDRLFAISTAYITLQTEHQINPAGSAAIVFQALATSEFEATLRDMEEVVKATGGESGTTVSTEDDNYGYRWMILRNSEGAPSVEDLAVGGHRDKVLGAAENSAVAGSPVELQILLSPSTNPETPTIRLRHRLADNPGGDHQEAELQLKAQMADELPIEPELERWFPLWGIPI